MGIVTKWTYRKDYALVARNDISMARPKLRIALQLSGQLRCFRESLPQLLALYGFYSEDVIIDAFALLTPDEGLREKNLPCLVDILGDSLKHLIMFPRTEEETNTQRSLLNNCSRDLKQLPALLGLSQSDGSLEGYCRGTAIQAYPRFLVNEVRQQYAAQNNITYDLVIMSRYDLYYYHTQIRPLHFMPDPAIARNIAYVSADLFFAAEPETMNVLMELCWNLPVAKCLLQPTQYYCPEDAI